MCANSGTGSPTLKPPGSTTCQNNTAPKTESRREHACLILFCDINKQKIQQKKTKKKKRRENTVSIVDPQQTRTLRTWLSFKQTDCPTRSLAYFLFFLSYRLDTINNNNIKKEEEGNNKKKREENIFF